MPENTSKPANASGSVGSTASALVLSTHAWKSAGLSATACILMRECDRPQNSVHCPK